MKEMTAEERKAVLKEIRSSLNELKHSFQRVCMQCERLYEAEGLGVEAPWRV